MVIKSIPPTSSALDQLRAALAGTLRWGARDGDVPVDRYLHRLRDDERALVEAVCDELDDFETKALDVPYDY